jgi:pimeloyl-ACP methyl ester carboxylesterase
VSEVASAGAPAADVLGVQTDDGVRLHVEVTGHGPDVLFLHEFSGDHRSWEQQVRFLSRRYRCIAFSARGYVPSDVPPDPDAYSQQRAVADAICVLDAVGSARAHVVGISMGGFTAVNLALEHPARLRSATAAACGYGADVERSVFRAEMEDMATLIRERGCEHLADLTAQSAYRLAFAEKDPRGFAEWRDALAAHDPVGAANTMGRVQATRPTLLELAARFDSLEVPLLMIAGDEDDPVLDANLAAKRSSPNVGLAILPRTAHTVNMEEPDAFNDLLLSFFTLTDGGTWMPRNPRSMNVGAGGWVR